jgi:lipid-A-disaccharide synthase-like uncharacterized protein
MNYLTHWYVAAVQNPDMLWVSIGFLGQALFGLRFVIQWLRSEQEGRSVIPIAFWYCSLFGAIVTLVYSLHLRAWPLVLGQAMPLPIYARNLWMVHRDRNKAAA